MSNIPFSSIILKFLISTDKNSMKKAKKKPYIIAAVFLLILFTVSCFLISRNESYYSKTIAKIISITEEESQMKAMNGHTESIKNQKISAIMLNGTHLGEEIKLENKASYSGVYDLNFKVGDEIFVKVQENTDNAIISSQLLGFKRDKYIVYITILFILLILLIGGVKGFKSLSSVIINTVIFSVAITLFLNGHNLTLVALISSVLFIIVSISLVSGINRKTTSAVVGTMMGTFVAMLITAMVILLTKSKGIHYEEMEFLTHPPEQIFFVEILIGTLGAIMDIAISISSSINEIYEKNPLVDRKVLINSGKEIGKDIMGTMANTLVFAYISGSIPIVVLLLKNDFPFSYIIDIDLCLEIIRALTGSIGIVVSIPITIYTSVLLLKNHKIGEA